MPDTNRYARKTYSPDGVNREYTIDIPFLDVTHFTLEHNGTELEYGEDWTLANPTTLRTTAVLAAGSETLVLTRDTPVLNPVAVFTSPGTFTFGNLNRIIKQLLYGVQESFDRSVAAETVLEAAEEAAEDALAAAAAAGVSAGAASSSSSAAAAAETAAEAAQLAAEMAAGSMNPSSNIAYTGNNTHAGTETFNSTATFNSLLVLGTAATFNFASAALARLRVALGVDSRTAVNDAAHTVTAADSVVAYTALTASRAVTLPAANTLNAGKRVVIVDESGSASSTVSISAVPSGSDKIAGHNSTQVIINVPRGRCELECNGVDGWYVIGEWSVAYTVSLGADVALNNTSNYFTGPEVAQGAVGTWRAQGGVVIRDTAGAAALYSKLWDGTTVQDSKASSPQTATEGTPHSMVGQFTSPPGNIRISCRDSTSVNGAIRFNESGNSKDSTLHVWRIA